MRYATIREMDISNGEGVGISLFVQGCPFHCYNCFNKETWDFNGGKEWTQEILQKFLKLADRPYIKRISILGGEPLADQNLDAILNLVHKIHSSFPEKNIWLYTGFEWNDLWINPQTDGMSNSLKDILTANKKRQEIIKLVNILIDGKYIDSQRELTLKFRGSKNQRVIAVKESIKKGKVVEWCR